MDDEEERKQYPWELWFLFWIGIAIIAVTIGLIGLYYLRWPMFEWLWKPLFDEYIDPQQSNYLFSATAQVLGALFALVFSITLIAVQFVTKYTHETMKIIFNWRLIFYMGGFACSVILPLWWLLNPTELGTYISIMTGSLVVLSLVLLFLDLKKRMNIEWIINYLKEQGLKALKGKPKEKSKLNSEEKKPVEETKTDRGENAGKTHPGLDFPINRKAQDNATAIDNIAMGAYGDHNYEVFRRAEMALLDFAIKIEGKFSELKKLDEKDRSGKLFEKAQNLHTFVCSMLQGTCEETIDNPRAPIIVVRHLGKTGAKAIEELLKSDIPRAATYEEIKDKIPQILNWAINIIMIVSEVCEKEAQDRILFACEVALAKMAEAANDLESLKELIVGKIRGVCKRFKNKKRWHPKVMKHMRSRRMWSLLHLLLKPIFHPNDYSG